MISIVLTENPSKIKHLKKPTHCFIEVFKNSNKFFPNFLEHN